MLNASYDIVYEVNAAGGYDADLHEFLITPEGTALMTVYDRHHSNLTSFRSFNATEDPDDARPNFIWDCLVQEVSLATGELLFEWRVSDHVDLQESYREIDDEGTYEVPWDWYHLNSIAKDELGNYLISARFTNGILYIDGRSGKISWRLGGRNNDFVVDGDDIAWFAWQHDARFHDLDAFPGVYEPHDAFSDDKLTTQLLTLFDNAPGSGPSKGMLLELSYPSSGSSSAEHAPSHTVRLVRQYINPENLQSSSQGSMQVLSHDLRKKVLIGYGYNAVWTEFDINGTSLCNAHFGSKTSWETGDVQSYRVYKSSWIGRPRTSPRTDLARDELVLYVSWNGATEVARWLVQSSWYEDEEHWLELLHIEKHGFETAIDLSAYQYSIGRYLRVLALDKHGSVLAYGTSDLFDRGEVPNSLLASVVRGWTTFRNVAFDNQRIVLFAGLIAVGLLSYKVARRLHSWRTGPRMASPIRWKHGLIYRRISGEV